MSNGTIRMTALSGLYKENTQDRNQLLEILRILVNFDSIRTLPITVDQFNKQEETASRSITIVQSANLGVKQC
ncbi:MAG: hypothetical protein HQ557_05800 [Bacteroidetes bacterium]|nr:hypothetical protein [Bacteroidota bacterium]